MIIGWEEGGRRMGRDTADHLDDGELKTCAQTRCLIALQPVQSVGMKKRRIGKGKGKGKMEDGRGVVKER